MRHIRHDGQTPNILEGKIICPGPGPGRQCPYDILEVVYIDIVADKKDAVDEHGGLICKNEVADALAELSGVGFKRTEFL